jgi:hypothetical protein
MTIHVDLIDRSTRGSAYDWERIAHALQTQVRLHVAQAWGIGNSSTVRVMDTPVPGHWPVAILDDSDIQGALGYHETDPGNPVLPVGKVFVKTDERYGLAPSVTLSHEVLEIIGDPWAANAIQATASEWWAMELCDPVEADRDGYSLEGVLLSDFVLPAWFFGGPGPYTYAKRVSRPRTLRPGGYQAKWSQSTGWTEDMAQPAPGATSRAVTMARNFDRRLNTFLSTLLPVED